LGFFPFSNPFPKTMRHIKVSWRISCCLSPKAYAIKDYWECLVIWLCLKVNFPCRKVLLKRVFPTLVKKTLTTYMQSTFAKCLLTTCTFDIWILKGAHNAFVMIVNFLSTSWNPKNVTIGLFGVHDMSGDAMIVKP
jgi:hypothetical protein